MFRMVLYFFVYSVSPLPLNKLLPIRKIFTYCSRLSIFIFGKFTHTQRGWLARFRRIIRQTSRIFYRVAIMIFYK